MGFIMKFVKKCFILMVLLTMLFSIGAVFSANLEDANITDAVSVSSDDVDYLQSTDDFSSLNTYDDSQYSAESEEIEIENWEELQYYSSLKDKNYVLKLKENTNYYPTDVSSSDCQIIFNNNVTIIGAEGAYIGDSSPNAGKIEYTAMKVPDNSGVGVTLQGVTFKWIATRYQPDGVFFVMGGNSVNYFTDCYFDNITTDLGHSSILHIKSGDLVVQNATFVNCTTDFGCISVYNPNDDPTKTCTLARMDISDSYFEGNYAKTEPGCINNCGVLIVQNTTFHRNSAFWWAGAIHTHGGANTTIYDSIFTENVAGWNGGALYTYSYLQIYNSSFIGNNCTTNNGGGAIGACKYLHAPYIYIENSLFEDNENTCWSLDELSTSGTGRGGAISFMDEGSLEVYNNTFIRNSASIGTAICAINGGLSYGSPDVVIVGNKFINHTRVGDVLDVRVATGSVAEIHDNYFFNNSLEFSKLKLTADDPVNGRVDFHIEAVLKNPNSFDSDIFDKSKYDVYVNNQYYTTVSSRDFSLNLGEIARVYVVPSISNSRSNEVSAGVVKTFIYVSQNRGNDANNGLTRAKPVKTLAHAIELANATENIVIIDGTFKETDLVIDYNLTITAENNATITVTGNGFIISDGDVKIENLRFINCNGSSTKNRIISQTSNGFLILEGCVFEGNNYKTHIEANKLEAENLVFNNNKDGSVIKADSLSIKSSTFTNNVATYSLSKALVMYKSTSPSKLEAENLTFIGNTVHSGCILSQKIQAKITDSTFISNTGTNKGSAIGTESSGSTLIESCKFINNTDTGKYSSVVYLSTGVVVRDSIFINNSYENTNNWYLNGNDAQLKKLTANNNWWGNTPENLSWPNLKEFSPSNTLPNGWYPAQYILVLNSTALNSEIELNERIPVQFTFTQIDKNGNVTTYDGVKIPSFDLVLTAVNGTCSDNKITVVNGVGLTYFTLTQMSSASLTGSFNGIDSTINFTFKKSTPELTINANDINVGSTANIVVNVPSGATGTVILKVGGITKTATISNSKATFSIPNLSAGTYVVEATYNGNTQYESAVERANLTVNKNNSTISISAGNIELNKNVIFSFTISNGATGTIDVYVNGNKQTINVGQTYTINNIQRGDYIVRAVYNGDSNYLPSEDEYTFEVGKLTPSMTVNVADITYGSDAIVNVNLNSGATGSVTVTIDGITSSGTVNNGKATVAISGISAGSNKQVEVFYSGDNNYKNASLTKTFNVNKAQLSFTIDVNNVKLGQNAVVTIQLPPRSGGTLTISGIKSETRNVPITGLITLTYSDLAVGTYTISARYNGDNYVTTSKSATFKVSDWDSPQWPNDGYDVKNTEKTPYSSVANGNVKWVKDIEGNVIGSMVIDSIGNIYITTSNGIYSINPNGGTNWIFNSQDAGESFSGIAISRDVILAPKTGDKLYFINQTTGVQYYNNIYQGSSNLAPIVDSDANIYTAGEYYGYQGTKIAVIPYKIWQTSTAPTEIDIGDYEITSPIVLVNDDIITFSTTTSLMGVELSSESIIFNIPVVSVTRPVIGANNIIYIISNGHVMGYNTQGSKVSDVKITGTPGNYLSIGNHGEVYSINGEGKLFDYSNGVETLVYDFEDSISGRLLVSQDDALYIGSDSGMFYAVDIDGNLLWSVNLNQSVSGSILMDANGTIYALSGNRIVAINDAQLKDPNLNVNIQNVTYGTNVIISVSVDSQATGTVSVRIGTKFNDESLIANGETSFNVANLASGTYTALVSYSGDSRFESKTASVKFNVAKAEPTINVNNVNIKVGQVLVINVVDLPNDATGRVSVTVNGISNTSNIANGQAKLYVSGLPKGDYEYTVTYSGDSNYLSKSISKPVSVGYVSTSFNANVQSTDINVGDVAKIMITGLPSDANGVVYIELNNVRYTASVNNGNAVISIPNLSEGTYNCDVLYTNDTKYSANSKQVSFNVNKITPTFTVNVNSNIAVGDNVVVDVTGLPTDATGLIIVSGDLSANKSISNGKAKLTIPQSLSDGTYTIYVAYAGDNKYNNVSVSKTIKINKVNPTFTVNINDINVDDDLVIDISKFANDATGQITVLIEGISNTSYINNGNSKVIIKQQLEAGYYPVLITYSGDDKYNSKEQTKYVNITKKQVSINVNAPNSIKYGNDLTIVVSNLPVDGATYVSLTGDLNQQGIINGNGVAEITVPNLNAGTYSFSVNYPTSHKYSIAKVDKTVTVNKAIVTMNIDYNNITYGQIAEITVSGLPNDTSGTVSLSNGDSSALTDGTATFTVANLVANNYTYRVTFSGDDNYNSKSQLITFNVAKINPTVNIAADSVTYGENLVVNVGLDVTATGRISTNLSGKINSGVISNGAANVNLGVVSAGEKTVLVDYAGDSNYNAYSGSVVVNVLKANPSIVIAADSISYGEKLPVNVTLNSSATGRVNVSVDDISKDSALRSGAASVSLSGVSAGSKTIVVSYAGDSNYNAGSNTFSVVVNKVDPVMVVSAGDVTYGENLIVNVKLNDDATGRVSTNLSGRINRATVSAGVANVNIGAIIAGLKHIVVTYAGDNNYNSISAELDVTVNKKTPTWDISYNNVYNVGDNLTINILNLPTDGAKYVTISGDVNKRVNLENGGAEIVVPNLSQGSHLFTIVYPGGNNYYNLTRDILVDVGKINIDLNPIVDEINYYSNPVEINLSDLPNDASGIVKVTVNGNVYESAVENGLATISIPDLSVGHYTAAVVYYGDDKYMADQQEVEFVVVRSNPDINVSAKDIIHGEDLVVTISAPNDIENSARVTVGGESKVVSFKNGVATVRFSNLDAGQYEIEVVYDGDSGYENSSATASAIVSKAVTDINIVADSVGYGEDLVVNITLPSDVKYRAIITMGNVSKYVSLKNGIASVKYSNLDIGSYDISVSYAGDNNYLKASSSVVAKVNKGAAKIEIVADDIQEGQILNVTVKLPSEVSRRARVTVGDESKLVSLKNGVGTVKFEGLTKGKYDIVVSYDGDEKYLKSSASTSISVTRCTANIEIIADDINCGESLTVGVKLPSDVTRRAKVTIDEVSKFVILKEGVGSVKFDGLAKGKHTITVTYDGDENYLKSSATAVVNVNRGLTDINVTANTVSYGEDLVVNVTLPSDVMYRALVTIGNVSKYVSLKEGIGSVKFSGLAVGNHEISVSYAGDANYLKTSVNVTAKVEKATPDIQITANDINVGETLNVAVKLPSDVTRRAVLSIDGNTQYVSLKNGVGTAKVTGLASGTHTVKVSYDGDPNYKASSSTTQIVVK